MQYQYYNLQVPVNKLFLIDCIDKNLSTTLKSTIIL